MKSKIPRSKRARANYRKKGYRKRFRRVKSVPDMAKLTENYNLTYPTPGGWNVNTMYVKRDFTMADVPRGAAVALAYQHYRIKKVTLIFRPQVDTFLGGPAPPLIAGYTAPNLYYMIDKSGSIPSNVSISALKSMGAKPIRLDEKVIKISWRPSVLTDTADLSSAGNIYSQYKISPWLSTNERAGNPGVFVPSSIDHFGIFWYVETTGVSTLQYTVEAVLDIEYKKPLNATLSGVESPEAVKC